MVKSSNASAVIASVSEAIQKPQSKNWIASSQVLLAMTAAVYLVQLLDRHRDALADADAHGGERAFAAALFHAMHRRHCQPRAAHAEGMAERDGAAMRIDEIDIFLDAELAQTGDALRGKGFIELDQVEVAD